MKNKWILLILNVVLIQMVFSDDHTSKLILIDKSVIKGEVKSIDDINVVLDTDAIFKKDNIQEIFLRNKNESSPTTSLILNNDAIINIECLLFLDNKISFIFFDKNMELPINLIKGIIYKNISTQNVKIWKKYFSLGARKTDIVFVLKDDKLIPIEGVIKEIEKDKIKILWDGANKTITIDKIVGVLFASIPEKLIINFEVQTIEGSKIFCNSIHVNNDGLFKLSINDGDEDDFVLDNTNISRIIFNNRKATYLSLLEPVEVTTDKIIIDVESNWEKDQSVWKRPLSIAGKTYAKGLGVHAFCKLKYKIPVGSIQFITDYGIDNEVTNNSGCIFKVIVDQKIFLEVLVKSSDGIKSFSLDLPIKSEDILLIIEPGPNLDIGDHGVWGSARFIKN